MVLPFRIHFFILLTIYMVAGYPSETNFRRIVGGIQSAPGAWPWQVSLLFNERQKCGGSLVSRHWVVSAAHCFNETSTNPLDWRAVLGEHNLNYDEVTQQSREVKSIYLHPKYKDGTPPDYDIALVRLSEPAVYDEYVSPIHLLCPVMTFTPGKECYVTGWGDTGWWEGSSNDILREAKVRLVPRAVCNNGMIHKSALCAGLKEGGVDTCKGDSGGPLSCEYRGRFFLTGVTSWGEGCAVPHKYGVYANMFELTPWVRGVINNHSN